MPRRPSVYWDKPTKSWRSDSGDRGETGRRKAVYFRDLPPTEKGKREAERLLKEFIAGRDGRESAAERLAHDPPLWEGIFKPFIADRRSLASRDKMAELTVKTHRHRLRYFAKHAPQFGEWAGMKFGHRKLSTLVADDATRWMDAMEKGGLGSRRINGVMASVKAALNWAAADVRDREPRRIIPANPFGGIPRLPMPDRPKPLPSRSEAGELLMAGWRDAGKWKRIGRRCAGCVRSEIRGVTCRRSHTKESAYGRAAVLLCRVQVNCGTRPSELCRATWGPTEQCPQAGWTARAWQDPKTGHWWGRMVVFGKTTRQTGRVRRIAVPPALTRAIERVRAAELNPVYIFPRLSRGTATDGSWNVNDLGRLVRTWRKSAGLEKHIVLYAMRHRIYTRAVHEGGLSADQAGAVGGTSGDTVRRTYLHADDTAIFEHATKIRRGHQSR